MPVWHERTKELVAKGELHVVGIVQEQHPDRTALYAQWREYDWPILWDPFGLAGLEVVPVLTGVDEHGVVRLTRPDPRRFDEQFVGEFLSREFDAPSGDATRPAAFTFTAAGGEHPVHRSIASLLRGGPDAPSIDRDVEVLSAHAAATEDPIDRFRAGVARRMRLDGARARADDFQAAIDAWSAALHARPNQYIWRRRIQQWGPRLDKPYPFYDWVEAAVRDVRARGDEPIRMRAPLSGAEVAGKTKSIPTRSDETATAPDPTGRVTRDEGALVRVEVAVAMHTGSAGNRPRTPPGASRVHVTLRPLGDAHWTPDADPPLLWVDAPDGWSLRSPLVPFAGVAGEDADREPLNVDFELSTPAVPLVPADGHEPPPDVVRIPAYVVYSVCLEDGTCVFRRQDVDLEIDLPDPPRRPDSGDDDD